MIKILFIIWLLFIHAFAFLAAWDTDLPYRIDRKLSLGLLNPPEIGRFYDNMLGSHLQLDGSVEAGSVIFLGDSLTQGLNVAAVTDSAINYGIGMDTSRGLLQRISQYRSLTRASTVIIAIGINDLIRVNRSPDDILENYQQILNTVSTANPDASIVLQAIFPVDERNGLAGTNKKIIRINSRLQSLAKTNEYGFVNLSSQFVGNQGNLKQKLHVGDGLHLSSEGYRLWIRALKQRVSPDRS